MNKDITKTIKLLKKSHDIIIDEVVSLNRIDSSLHSSLTREQHVMLFEIIKKIKDSNKELRNFIDSINICE